MTFIEAINSFSVRFKTDYKRTDRQLLSHSDKKTILPCILYPINISYFHKIFLIICIYCKAALQCKIVISAIEK